MDHPHQHEQIPNLSHAATSDSLDYHSATDNMTAVDHATLTSPVKKKAVLFTVDEHKAHAVKIPESALNGGTATKPLITGFAHEMGIANIGRGSDNADVHAPNSTYYGNEASAARDAVAQKKKRAMSTLVTSDSNTLLEDVIPRERRFSLDEPGNTQYLLNVEKTLERLLAGEDTDQNHQITVEDDGPKVSFSHL
jgi:hypothetical protein